MSVSVKDIDFSRIEPKKEYILIPRKDLIDILKTLDGLKKKIQEKVK